jgi:hypothetical protein
MNLLHNALKFTPAGGTISVETGMQNDAANLRVRDTGCASRRRTCRSSLSGFTAPTLREPVKPAEAASGLQLRRPLPKRTAEKFKRRVRLERAARLRWYCRIIRIPYDDRMQVTALFSRNFILTITQSMNTILIMNTTDSPQSAHPSLICV